MLKNVLILPDGTEVTSGVGHSCNIRGTSLTECVNSGEELTLGSVCANLLEVTLMTPGGTLGLTAGDEVTLYREDAFGTRKKAGIYRLEKPTRPTANTMKLTGYDRAVKLDKDLTGWLRDLDGWPYALETFAGMICQACGLTLVEAEIPNRAYPVQAFSAEATGRQLLRWVGEICCRFCRANEDGEMEWGWYEDSGITVGPSGDRYFYQGSLKYEDYQVAPVDAVQLQLSGSDTEYLWPAAEEGANAYIISGNPILAAAINADTQAALEVIQAELSGLVYTPCKVAIPACTDIRAGQTVTIRDRNGKELTACVMTRTQKGQRVTLEGTGSPRRDSAAAVNSKPVSQVVREQVAGLTQEELLKRLTNYWTDDSLYLTEEGKLAIKATAILAGILRGIEIIGESGSIGGFEMSDHTLTAKFRRDFDFTQEDVDKARAYYMGQIDLTVEEIARLDVTMNGRIQAGDAMVMTSMINGSLPNYTEGRIVIDATNPRECIIIEVTGGYRAGQRTVLAMGFASVSRMESDLFSCGGLDGYTGEIAAGDATLTVKGGIIVGVS